MPTRNIVRSQKVTPEKVHLAKTLRKEMTVEEQRLWTALRSNQLSGFHFRRQQIVDGYILDFYCHAANLAIELDGSVHDQQQDYDQERDTILAEKRNLWVLRVKNDEIRNDMQTVLRKIEAECKRRIEAKARR